MYCTNCGNEMNDNQAICLSCGVKTGDGKSFCANCGGAVNEGQEICMNCGVALKKQAAAGDLGGQNKWVLAILSCPFVLGLGLLGIHNFLMGEVKKGIIKIVTLILCFGIPSFIFALVDFIKILTDSYVIDPEKYI